MTAAQFVALLPLIVLAMSGMLNIALNLFFVLVLGMDVAGVATATVLANAFSAAVLMRWLGKTHSAVRFRNRRSMGLTTS